MCRADIISRFHAAGIPARELTIEHGRPVTWQMRTPGGTRPTSWPAVRQADVLVSNAFTVAVAPDQPSPPTGPNRAQKSCLISYVQAGLSGMPSGAWEVVVAW